MSKHAVAALALVSVAGLGCWRWTPATFAVRNESGQTVRALTVEVAGRTYCFADVPLAGEVTGSFRVGQEATLLVRGRLADGTAFAEPCGYVVWEEFAPHVAVVVRCEGPGRIW